MKMRDVQASFVVCTAFLIGVHCTILKNTATNKNENKTGLDATCKISCANNGVCDGEGDAVFCRCKLGTSGELCENVDACKDMWICGDGYDVKCVYDESTGGGKCICENSTKLFDYKERKCGALCSTNDDCGNFEKCTQSVIGVSLCRCLPGRSGESCKHINGCINGKHKSCKRDNGRCFYNKENEMSECDCGHGKIWDDRKDQGRCRRTCKDDCANHGVCEGDGDVKFCTCSSITEGDMCEKIKVSSKDKNLCGSGNDVKLVYDKRMNSFKCVCDNSSKLFDYDEKRCRVPCKDDCLNNGKCEYIEADRDCFGECKYLSKFCFCKQGTSGDLCENVDDCAENFCGTKTDVKCVYDEARNKAICQCDDVKKSFDQYGKMCKPFCRTNTDCRITEKCAQDEDGQGICVCKAGRSGDKCQFVDDCMTGKYSDCNGGNGRCSYNDVAETAECDCGDKRWDESRVECRCKSSLLVSIKDVDLSHHGDNKTGFSLNTCRDNCVNNGACEGVDDAHFCRCNAGTSGDHCEVVNDCDWAEICGNSTNVKCVYDESTGGGNCLCENNTKFFDYHRKECRVPCEDDCANQGECVVSGEHKFCKCKPGTSGDLCNITKDCDKPDFCGTKADVKCVFDENSETSYCKCNDPMKRFDPITHECIRGMCTNNTCKTGEITVGSDGGGTKCYCGVPFSGERCEEGGVCFCLRHCS